MKNVTITLDEKVARWARVWAAERNLSVSRFVGQLLEEKMREESGYDMVMTQFLSVQPQSLKKGGRYLPATRCMSDLIFVDTNVLVYCRDADERDKQPRARAWLEASGVLDRAASAPRFSRNTT